MGKYMKKCRAIGELAVMEVSQVVGVRTRARTLALAAAAAAAAAAGASAKRRKVASTSGGASGTEISYLQLRSRSLVMTPRVSRSPANSVRRASPELDRLSRCSSNASSEVERSGDREHGEDYDAETSRFEGSKARRETTPSSELRTESGDLQSTAGRKPRKSPSAVVMPPEAEIEEFFAAAERKEQQRFADKYAPHPVPQHTYNYDVVRDAPSDGRYEWVRLGL